MGVSKNIAVKITTNGTILPKINGKTIFDYIPHFKKISFLVSIEFWGAKNDYLRYGSKWNVILNNALKLTEHGCKVSYHSTVNALNAGYLDEMPMKQSYGGVVKGKGQIYSIASIPLDIRKKYMEKSLPVKIKNMLVNEPWSEDQMWTMLRDIKARDTLRGTCLIDIFPEWTDYYNHV